MNKILYTSPHVPAEWIAAHGCIPSRVMPSGRDRAQAVWERRGVCPYVRAFGAEVTTSREASGIVVVTVCDQMRRAFDVLCRQGGVPLFLMDVPSTWQSQAARGLYLDELNRLSRFLVSLGGTRPSDLVLTETMRTYDDTRTALLDLQSRVSPRQWIAAAEDFGRTGTIPPHDLERGGWARAHPTASGVPLALVGGPLRREDLSLYDQIEECGGSVALDVTESGQRGLCRRFDRRALLDDPLLELADAYFDGVLDVSSRPNHRFYGWLAQTLTQRYVRGIIVHRFVGCDLWHAEVARLRQGSGLPVLDLDADGEEAPNGHRRATRIGAFLEMLR